MVPGKKLMQLAIAKQDIEKVLNEIFDFILNEETGESHVEKLNNAWHEIFGMKKVLNQAQTNILDNTAAEECVQILQMLTQAMAVIEMLYDEHVNGSSGALFMQ